MSGRSPLSCPRALDRFASFLDGELGAEDGRPVEDHLDSCETCLDRARDLAAVHRDLALLAARGDRFVHDPIPALLAKVRWDAAGARLSRRSRFRLQTPGMPVFWTVGAAAAALAALLLFATAGVDRRPAPRGTARHDAAPAVLPSVPAEAAPPPILRTPEPPAPQPPKPVPTREEPPAAVPELPSLVPERPAPSVRPTIAPVAPAAVARVERAGRPAEAISIGDTVVADGPAVVVYPDGTRFFLAPETAVSFGGRGKTVAIVRGEIAADVTPQPRDEPLSFSTPGAEVKVVGTVLTVASRPDSTLVTVEKGRVQVTRKSDRWSVSLREGQYASVEPGRLPVARPLPPNLLADPGFEAEGRGWEGIFNRAMERNYGGISVTPDVFRSGGRAVQLITQPAAGFDREVFQDVAVGPGDSVEASGWLRTAGIGGKGVSLSLLWLGPGSGSDELTEEVRSKGLVLREDVAGILAGTNEWTRLGARGVAPPQAKRVRFLMYADVDPGGPATAWFDDLVLRRIQRGK